MQCEFVHSKLHLQEMEALNVVKAKYPNFAKFISSYTSVQIRTTNYKLFKNLSNPDYWKNKVAIFKCKKKDFKQFILLYRKSEF